MREIMIPSLEQLALLTGRARLHTRKTQILTINAAAHIMSTATHPKGKVINKLERILTQWARLLVYEPGCSRDGHVYSRMSLVARVMSTVTYV